MRVKKYTHGLTFFITVDMFEALKQISDEKQIGMYVLEDGDKNFYYVEKLSVLPEYRHRGYGDYMMKHAIEYSKEKKADGVSVALIDEQKILKDWYIKLGFYETIKKNFDNLPFTVCFMELKL